MTIEERHIELVHALAKPGSEILNAMKPDEAHLLHMALLLAGEVGELVDAIKKGIIYRRPFDHGNIIEELGDIEFALRGIRLHFDISRELALLANIIKLQQRYPSGSYSDAQAIERADKA